MVLVLNKTKNEKNFLNSPFGISGTRAFTPFHMAEIHCGIYYWWLHVVRIIELSLRIISKFFRPIHCVFTSMSSADGSSPIDLYKSSYCCSSMELNLAEQARISYKVTGNSRGGVIPHHQVPLAFCAPQRKIGVISPQFGGGKN